MTDNIFGSTLFFSKRTVEKLQKVVSALMLVTMVVTGSVLPYSYNKAEAALAGVSLIDPMAPVSDANVLLNPTNGFPVWYSDPSGTTLQLCLGAAPNGTGPADPNCILPTVPPTEANFPSPFNVAPITDPITSFPSESFYYFADAEILGAGPDGLARLRLRMILEGAFATPDDPATPLIDETGLPVNGQQTTFLRVNVQQADGLVPNSTYTVTYPFGEFVFHTDATGHTADGEGNAGGGGAAFRNQDGLAAAGDFTSFMAAPTTLINKFLKSTSPVPPAGYLGDGLTPSIIEPGPNGNFFRVVGPSAGGLNDTIETNQWIVAGKLADAIPPVITVLGPNPDSVIQGAIYTDPGATALDNVDGDLTASIQATTISTAVLGPQTITYTVSDAAGNIATATRTVDVVAAPISDTTAPVLTLPADITAEATSAAGANVSYIATANDAIEGPVTPICDVVSGSLFPIGTTAVTCTAADSVPNTSTGTFNVVVQDTTPPTITLNGDAIVNVAQNAVYADAGAVATDVVDPAVAVTLTGSVDTAILGQYVLTYNATDSSANVATPITRTVNVIDATLPVITVTGGNPAVISKGLAYADAGATALDDVDGDITANIQVTGLPVDTSSTGDKVVVYSVADRQGNLSTASRTVRVVNDAPVANPDVFTIPEDVPRNILFSELLGNDTDPNPGDLLRVIAVANPLNGIATLLGDSVNFVPNLNFNGFAGFDYTVSDVDDATSVGSVTITVSPGAPATPVALPDSFSTAEDTPLLISFADLLANDTDPNNNLPLSVISAQNPSSGSVVMDELGLTYTPALNFAGTATFAYTVSNSVGVTADSIVTITITPNVAVPPILTDDAVTVDEDASAIVDVLANDNNPINHLPLSVTAVSQGASGNVTFTPASVTYAPNPNFNGVDSFTYTATDAVGQTAVTTVNVTVSPVNDSPVINPIAGQTVEAGSLLAVTATASDIDGDALTYSLVNAPLGMVIDPVTGVLNWTPDVAGNYIATVSVSDGTVSAETQLSVTVAPQPVVITRIEIKPSPIIITVGEALKIDADVFDQHDVKIVPTPVIDWLVADVGVASMGYQDMLSGLTAGATTLTASSGGVSANASVTVNNPPDVKAPDITILGANPVNLTVGDVYTDAGATAVDDVDGDVTGNIVPTGLPISTAAAGSFSVTYSVSDAAGNSSSATRTVNVALPPAVLTTINVTPASAIVGVGATQQLSATTLDQFGAPFAAPATWSSSNSAIATVDATGLVRGVAVGAVTVSATSGAVTGSANITVPDAEAPVISIIGDNPATITVGQAYNDAGATARDGVDGVITDKIVSVSNVNNKETGTYFVTYTVKDTANNTATITRAVNVLGIVVTGGGSAGSGGGGGGFFSVVWPPEKEKQVAANNSVSVATIPKGQVLGESTVRFNANMGRGSRGESVRALQLMLQEEGFFSGPVTGFFGRLTQRALAKFQKNNGIKATGFLGPLTRAKINTK